VPKLHEKQRVDLRLVA